MSSFPSFQGPDRTEVRPNGHCSHLQIHAIKIFVRDQDQSLRFYVDQLGFDVAFDAELQSGERWVAVGPPDGTAVLTLVAPKAGTKDYELIGRATGVVFVTENVAAKYGEWRRRGVRFHFAPRLRRVRYERQAPAIAPLPGPSSSASERPPVWGGV